MNDSKERLQDILQAKREEILRIAAKHGARNVRIFGSTVRGEAGPESDVDFLVDVEPVHSSWFPAGLILDLEELLGQKVDVVTEDSIYWLLRRRILKEARPL
jgi:predicted nucleotidyltransferase